MPPLIPKMCIGPYNPATPLEQGSTDEVAQCCFVILNTEAGQRTEDPEFGRPPLEFTDTTPDEIRSILAAFEPRADELSDVEVSEIVNATQYVEVNVG